MNSPTLTTVACPICQSTVGRELFRTQDYKQRVTNDVFTVSRCQQCGAGYLSTRPTKAGLAPYYDETFYWSFENDQRVAQDPEQLLAIRKDQLRAKVAWLESMPPGKLLDIGTQKGEFVHYVRELGWDAEGVEFSDTPANLFNVPIRYGEFLEMDFGGEPCFDCITMWAVLEHVYEPAAYVKKIAELLKPNGRFIFLVTNFNTLQGRYYEMDDFPRHLNLFTKRSARRIVEDHGMELVRGRTDQRIFGGKLQGGLVYAAKRLGGYSRADVMFEWKHNTDLVPFFHQWRGQPSVTMRWLSRLDRLVLTPIEALLDRLGHGFVLTIEAKKR